jgi:hypothetical protein
MKIVGTDGQGRYLCAVTPHEIEKITGDERFGYRGVFHDVGRNASAAMGTVVAVGARYERLQALEQNRGRLDQAIGQLRTCADLLEPLGSVVTLPEPPLPFDVVDDTSEGQS